MHKNLNIDEKMKNKWELDFKKFGLNIANGGFGGGQNVYLGPTDKI